MSDELLELTASVVAAMLSNNAVERDALPELIRSVHDALATAGHAPVATDTEVVAAAVSARRSLADPMKIISMIDGKPYSSLKRHLAKHGLTPVQYRARYGLKPDYPMVAPAYSQRRSEVAKSLGLGRKTKPAEPVMADVAIQPVKPIRRKLKLALGKEREQPTAGEDGASAAS